MTRDSEGGTVRGRPHAACRRGRRRPRPAPFSSAVTADAVPRSLPPMGFLDKVKGALESAKDELDKSGLLDQLKPDAGTPGVPVTAGGDAVDLEQALRHGAVDPRTLI